MSSFWKFMGGLVVGAAAAHLVNEEYKKRKQGPPPSVKRTPEPQVEKNMKEQVSSEMSMVQDLIKQYENMKNRNRKQSDTLDLLRIKMKQMQTK